MKGNVIFVVDNLSSPRCIKRIKAFYDEGFSVKVYGYDRGKNLNNQLPQQIEPIVLGKITNGKGYLLRAFNMRRDIKRIIKENINTNSMYYSFGFISSLLFSLSKVPYIYEISDIRYGSYKKFIPVIGLFKRIDRRTIKKSLATVMTSGGFKDFLGSSKNEIYLIPNKINPALLNYERSTVKKSKEGIRFAFVGYQSIIRFAKVIGDCYPQYSFSFYGSALQGIKEECEKLAEQYDNVFYRGPFHNPEDLPGIYKDIDVVISSYDINTLNERIAEPNKLYESIFFCRPIVVSQNTYLSKQVEKYHCGFSIDATNETSIKRFIDYIKKEKIEEYSSAEYVIPVSELIDETRQVIGNIKRFQLLEYGQTC